MAAQAIEASSMIRAIAGYLLARAAQALLAVSMRLHADPEPTDEPDEDTGVTIHFTPDPRTEMDIAAGQRYRDFIAARAQRQ